VKKREKESIVAKLTCC